MSDSKTQTTVQIPAAKVLLEGDLSIPENPVGVVIFAHGSGSSRNSVRNRFVAKALNHERLGTLLLDLLTTDEEPEDLLRAHLRFDIAFLAARLSAVTEWIVQETGGKLNIGYFGASSGAAAALVAAAEHPEHIHAIVSRGGRPDLALEALKRVHAPVMFVVGGKDLPVLKVNLAAFETIRAPRRFEVIEGATHLFEETGALEEVARLAGEWFSAFLPN